MRLDRNVVDVDRFVEGLHDPDDDRRNGVGPIGIDGELELEGLHVPLAELMVAIRNGGRFVPLGDNQFATISDQLRARMTMIDDVSSVDGGALRMARATASWSKPSTACTCQPAAAKRFMWSSDVASDVGPSIEMLLLSNSRISRPSPR